VNGLLRIAALVPLLGLIPLGYAFPGLFMRLAPAAEARS
jgi:hypothetical protein